jgi:ADP-ribosylglycohydrolase
MPASAVAADPYKGATVLWAEQIPLAFASFVFGRGDFADSMIACVNLGRDADSIAATTGRLAGALSGLSGLPADWVEILQTVNIEEMDLLAQGNRLADLAGVA